ncbi:hypothetical protein [Ancylobacter mangrovi]|uniref:hypothetical protein n=1 Tax=Ancylobacter mangrovi TaxID=2972472 RepID=UPI0021631965|nr:hypothetical protein [Ancylobacter mangrovi]MCS0501583.1 hypothetical protein [Ancylobacter mangrovi]
MSDKQHMFWMVYGLGQGQPTVRHKTYASARDEAARLARNHPGVSFFVLAAVSVSRRVDVETTMLNPGVSLGIEGLDEDALIPF